MTYSMFSEYSESRYLLSACPLCLDHFLVLASVQHAAAMMMFLEMDEFDPGAHTLEKWAKLPEHEQGRHETIGCAMPLTA